MKSNATPGPQGGTGENQTSYPNNQTFTFCVMPGNYPATLRSVMTQRRNWIEGYDKVDKRLQRDTRPFIFNHFEVNRGLCTKTGLIRSLKQYYKSNEQASQAGYTAFDSTPTTFLVSSNQDDQEILQFIARFKEINQGGSKKERVPQKHCEGNIWLVKPAAMNQGRGIEIFKNIKDIQQFIFTRPQPNSFWVVQKYVEKPMLYGGRKFDLRIWALLTQRMELYVYKKGYVRTSSDDYSLSNKNNYVHLTNNCLQKFGDNYGKHEDGNTLGFEALQQYLDQNFGQYGLDVYEDFMPRIKDLIIDTILATKNGLNPSKRKHCFELFGYDFLIDEDFRIWLIEVNTNPYQGIPNEYIQDLLPKMIDDMVKLTVDPIYQPREVEERENLFELQYSDNPDNFVNKRRPFSLDDLYPVPELRQTLGVKKSKRTSQTLPESQRVVQSQARLQQQKILYGQPQPSLQKGTHKQSISYMPSTPQKERSKSLVQNSQAFKSSGNKSIDTIARSANSSTDPIKNSKSNSNPRNNKLLKMKSSEYQLRGDATNESSFKGIKEVIEEEDKKSDRSAGEEEEHKRTIKIMGNPQKPKKNYLMKSILDQTKELCYEHSTLYKDFDSMFQKLMARFEQWEIFDDAEIQLSCEVAPTISYFVQSLKIIASSGQVVSLIKEKNFVRLLNVYDNQEVLNIIREQIVQAFYIIAKNTGLRKVFLKHDHLNIFLKHALKICDNEKMSMRTKSTKEETVKLLCVLSTVKTNKFYIPGETNLVEKLKKMAFDRGLIAVLTHIYRVLDSTGQSPDLKQYVKEKVLNLIELKDLYYHAQIVQQLIQNLQGSPQLKEEGVVASNEEEDEGSLISNTPQNELVSKKSVGKFTSPLKGSVTKKENINAISTQAYFSNQSNRELQHTKEGYQLLSGAFQTSFKENYQSVAVGMNEQLKEESAVQFPEFFVGSVDLEELRQDLLEKAEMLKERIDKRRGEEDKKRNEKIEEKKKEEQDRKKEKEEKRERLNRKIEENKKKDALRKLEQEKLKLKEEEDKKKLSSQVQVKKSYEVFRKNVNNAGKGEELGKQEEEMAKEELGKEGEPKDLEDEGQ